MIFSGDKQVSSTVPGQAEPSAVPRRLSSLKENVGIFTGSLKLAAHEINTIWSDSLFMLLDSITAAASYPTNLIFLYDWKIFSQCWSRIWYCLEKFFVQIIYHSPSILNKYSSFSITDDAQITVNLNSETNWQTYQKLNSRNFYINGWSFRQEGGSTQIRQKVLNYANLSFLVPVYAVRAR